MNPKTEIIWDREDWDPYMAAFSRKLRQEYSVDVSGSLAAGNTDYFFSGSYLDDGGYSMNQYYKRYTFRANVNTNIRDWWRAGGSVSYSASRQNTSGNSRALNFYTSLSGMYLRNERQHRLDIFRKNRTPDVQLQQIYRQLSSAYIR